MTVILDEKAQQVIARRRQRGRDADLVLRRVHVPHSGYAATVDWTNATREPENADYQRVGDVAVLMDKAIARYARWHPVRISASHLGPLNFLTVDDPALTFSIASWERTHPGLAH